MSAALSAPVPMAPPPAAPRPLPVAVPEPRTVRIRRARPEDAPAIERLQAQAAGESSAAAGPAAGWPSSAGGFDPQLLADGTWLVAQAGDRIVGSGGWSFRAAGPGPAGGRAPRLEPGRDAARLCGILVDPAFARRGVAVGLLVVAEAAARSAGFDRAELLATPSEAPVYLRHGYTGLERVEGAGGVEAMRLGRTLVPPPPQHRR